MEFSGADLTNLIKMKGADGALEELILRFNSAVRADISSYLGFKRCSDPISHGDDVCSLTWQAVYRDITKYCRGEKAADYQNPAAWLFRIRRRLCIKHILVHIRERNIVSIDPTVYAHLPDKKQFADSPFIDNPVESQFYARESLANVRACVSSLSKGKQLAIELYMNGFTHKEIAICLEITPDLSRQWIIRVIRIIRKKCLY
jgi:DNA-directed RNA polymerase specialized sigma24 family protein